MYMWCFEVCVCVCVCVCVRMYVRTYDDSGVDGHDTAIIDL